jgi:hypothetical protein
MDEEHPQGTAACRHCDAPSPDRRCRLTWTKLSDDFGDQCADLSDAAFRTHVEGLLWVMRRETGGRLTHRDLRRFAESEDAVGAAAELVALGWWTTHAHGFTVVHHIEHQPEPDVLLARREADAARQRRRRRKAAKLDDEPSRRDTHRDDTRDPGRDGTDRDRSINQAGPESDQWQCVQCQTRPRDTGFDLCDHCAGPGGTPRTE